jgi:hypothetical protein
VDWSKVSALSLPGADSMLWDSPGPPPHISGKWLIFVEGLEERGPELLRVKEFLAAVSPDDIWGTKRRHTSARLLLSEPSRYLRSDSESNDRVAVAPTLKVTEIGKITNPVTSGDMSELYIGARL